MKRRVVKKSNNMLIKTKTILYGDTAKKKDSIKPEDIHDIKKIDIIYCCKEMKEAFSEHYIGFGEFEGPLNKNSNINIYHCIPFPEGAAWDEKSIKYCPFCREKITIKNVKTVKMKDYY